MSDTTESKQYPSQVVAPTKIDSVSQQASTQPGDGSEVRIVDQRTREELINDPNVHVIEVPGQKVPFKDQVIGYAQKTRGTLLGKTETKQHGDQILEGRAAARECNE
ncbi:hypothetical protein PLEOSDRAFT_1093998 [Pleurotus ostreatus PC15]|uniref:Uncharacterized protein n=1 Tax=Pleurotus ostreatus (strain PC15) TaxID=1137138 RepID=A0A067NMV7_PLEO1|nr:hypothetical protein PLEOSDRAFT_1093998 [Pleurotus ostreatus PC15]